MAEFTGIRSFLWVTSDAGVGRYVVEDLLKFFSSDRKFVSGIVFGKPDGMAHEEANGQKSQPSVWVGEEGDLLVSTVRGIAEFDTNRIHQKGANLSSVTISKVLIDGGLFYSSDPHSFNRAKLHTPIEIPPGSGNVIQIEFQMPSSSRLAYDRYSYEYRLPGVLNDWQDIGNTEVATLTNLKPGDYQFEVRGKDNHGKISRVTILNFNILPTLLQHRGFRGAAFFIFILFLGGLHMWRRNFAAKMERLKMLEKLQNEKKRISRDLHDSLGAGLSKIVMYSGLLAPKITNREHSKIMWRICQLSNMVAFDARNLLQPKSKNELGLSAFIEDCKDLVDTYLEVFEIKAIYHIDHGLPDSNLSPTVQHEIRMIIKESIQNVSKHANASFVTFTVTHKNNCIRFGIQDDGSGLSEVSLGSEKSYGLTNIHERAKSIGAKIVIDSLPDSGTRITVQVPVKNLRSNYS